MKYVLVAKIGFKKVFAYDKSVIINIVVSIINIFILVMFWRTIYNNNYERVHYMVEYSINSQILSILYGFNGHNKMIKSIRTGSITTDLIKPWNYIVGLFAEDIGTAMANFIIMAIPVIFVSHVLWRYTFSITYFVFYLVNFMLSLYIYFGIKMLVAMCSFWVIEAGSLVILIEIVIQIFSGKFLPSFIMPPILKRILESLPFVWIYQRTIEMLMENKAFSFESWMQAIFQQLLWALILASSTFVVWRKAKRKLVVQGG